MSAMKDKKKECVGLSFGAPSWGAFVLLLSLLTCALHPSLSHSHAPLQRFGLMTGWLLSRQDLSSCLTYAILTGNMELHVQIHLNSKLRRISKLSKTQLPCFRQSVTKFQRWMKRAEHSRD
ncbi:MAG: hypothetical protein J3Q66DRAFT_371243 [Benniella sp.]|nr:MAG: hypothetical protein J3Q66DRAFT_371243 [Benniella sp.]